jgi:hypothetical protein
MRKYCTVCSKRLEFWERLWGRFDHDRCRTMVEARYQDTNPLAITPHVQSALRPQGMSAEFLSASRGLFATAEESAFWHHNS